MQAEAAATKKRADAEKKEKEELQQRVLSESLEYTARSRKEDGERAVREAVHKSELETLKAKMQAMYDEAVSLHAAGPPF